MGREIKHVPMDFDWPLHQIWKGYINPYYEHSRKCPFCNGSGYNAETKKLSDGWYSFNDSSQKWHDNITQDEVDALVKRGRLMDFTHKFVLGMGWIKKNPPYRPTAEEVNASERVGGTRAHDSINQWICVETRAKRLGVYGLCEACHGNGNIWSRPKYRKLAENWEREEPPTGDGWQLWETVSEGSPISPVFATRTEFVNYLVREGYSRNAAENFCDDGWAPSMVMMTTNQGDRVMASDIEACGLKQQKTAD